MASYLRNNINPFYGAVVAQSGDYTFFIDGMHYPGGAIFKNGKTVYPIYGLTHYERLYQFYHGVTYDKKLNRFYFNDFND